MNHCQRHRQQCHPTAALSPTPATLLPSPAAMSPSPTAMSPPPAALSLTATSSSALSPLSSLSLSHVSAEEDNSASGSSGQQPAPKRCRTRGGFRGRGARGGRGVRVRGGGVNRRGKGNGGQASFARTTQGKAASKKKNSEFCWNDNNRPYWEFPFSGNPGVKAVIHDKSCPLSILKTFLTEKLVAEIVSHTNKYADLVKSLPQVQERMPKKYFQPLEGLICG